MSGGVSTEPVLDQATRTVAISVNGQPLRVASPSTVADLLASRDLVGKRVAVELNGSIVPRSRHASTMFSADDRVEIVVAVGGG